jgi:sigma-B regulation protein RsbU (phosphoserine phosphatase)
MADNAITSESIDLSPGDTLLFFSDGVTEAFDEAEELFGEDRLLSHLAGQPGATASETVELLLAAVRAHAGNAKQSDDISIVASRWDPSQAVVEGLVTRADRRLRIDDRRVRQF